MLTRGVQNPPLPCSGNPLKGAVGEPLPLNRYAYVNGNPVNGAVGELGWSNPYAYVNGNPVNFVDPSGMIGERPEWWDTCQQQKQFGCCCGPDATEWIYREITNHRDYAKTMKTFLPGNWDPNALFKRIVQPPAVSAFEAFQLATYGLAVDYKYVDYHQLEAASSILGNQNSPTPQYTCTGSLRSVVVSVCDECQDASDYGNFILGVVISAAGEDERVAQWAGEIFNILSKDTAANADTTGVTIGYSYDAGGHNPTYNRQVFCQRLKSLGTAWRDQRVISNPGCQKPACGENGPTLKYANNSVPYWNGFVSKTIYGGNNPEGFSTPADQLFDYIKRLPEILS